MARCGSPAAASGEPLEIQFEAHRVFDQLYPVPILTTLGSQVTIDGEYGIGYPCFTFEGDVRLLNGVITLEVVAKGTSTNCQAIVSLFRYHVTLAPLPPATYGLRLWHVNGTLRHLVASWSVTVPQATQ